MRISGGSRKRRERAGQKLRHKTAVSSGRLRDKLERRIRSYQDRAGRKAAGRKKERRGGGGAGMPELVVDTEPSSAFDESLAFLQGLATDRRSTPRRSIGGAAPPVVDGGGAASVRSHVHHRRRRASLRGAQGRQKADVPTVEASNTEDPLGARARASRGPGTGTTSCARAHRAHRARTPILCRSHSSPSRARSL